MALFAWSTGAKSPSGAAEAVGGGEAEGVEEVLTCPLSFSLGPGLPHAWDHARDPCAASPFWQDKYEEESVWAVWCFLHQLGTADPVYSLALSDKISCRVRSSAG